MSLSSIARLKEFKTLDFGEKHEIVTLCRPMPSIPLTQEVRNKSRTILRKFSSDYYKKSRLALWLQYFESVVLFSLHIIW